MDPVEEKLKALEVQKERLIRQYMSLQDKADTVNGEIYRTCCGIEALNSQIGAVQEQLRKAALKPSPTNGKSHPPA